MGLFVLRDKSNYLAQRFFLALLNLVDLVLLSGAGGVKVSPIAELVVINNSKVSGTNKNKGGDFELISMIFSSLIMRQEVALGFDK